MSQALAFADLDAVPPGGAAPRSASVPGVEVFATGVHHGEPYTEADLDAAVRNFYRFKAGPAPLYEPPVAIGHEDDQQVLDETGLPAGGVVENLRKVWDAAYGVWKLIADFADVPLAVADWIDQRMYRRVSAEFYDDPEHAGLPGSDGLVLRRVSLLGAEPPCVKTLRTLPFAVYSDRPPRRPTRLCFTESRRVPGSTSVRIFSEVRPMNRDELLGWVSSLDDATLAQLVAQGQAAQAAAPTPDVAPQGVVAAMSDEDSDSDTADMADAAGVVTAYLASEQAGQVGAGILPTEPPHTMSADTPAGDAPAKPVACADAPPADPAKPLAAPQVAFSEKQLAALIQRQVRAAEQAIVTRVEKQFAEKNQVLLARLEQHDRLAKTRLKSEKDAAVKAFCERMVRDKKCLPAEVDAGSKTPNLFHRLMRADAAKRVHKFGERSLSEFELQMAEIEGRDAKLIGRIFSEKVPHGAGGSAAPVAAQLSPERKAELLEHSLLGRAVARDITKK